MKAKEYTSRNFNRAVQKVEAGEDHFRARSAWLDFRRAMSGGYTDAPVDVNERAALHAMIVNRLGQLGVVAEIYARRGDLGSGMEDSADQMRVIARDGHETGIDRLPLDGYQRYVVRATNEPKAE